MNLQAVPYVRFSVPTDGTVKTSRFKLAAGHSYRFTVAGLYSYGTPRQVADASCVWSAKAHAWQPGPSRRTGHQHGGLDLRINGVRLLDDECHTGSHVYHATFTATHTRALSLRVANKGETSGRLVVTLARHGADVTSALPSYPALTPAPARSLVAARGYGLVHETVTVPATSSAVTTAQELQAGAQYRITVGGSVGLGGGAQSDGECVALRGTWYRQASLDRRFPDQDHGNLYVDGVPFAGQDGGCDSRTSTAPC